MCKWSMHFYFYTSILYFNIIKIYSDCHVLECSSLLTKQHKIKSSRSNIYWNHLLSFKKPIIYFLRNFFDTKFGIHVGCACTIFKLLFTCKGLRLNHNYTHRYPSTWGSRPSADTVLIVNLGMCLSDMYKNEVICSSKAESYRVTHDIL